MSDTAHAQGSSRRCGSCNREHTGTVGDNAWAMVYLGIQHCDTKTEMLGPIGIVVCGPECIEKAIEGLVLAAKEVARDVRPSAKA